jgi:hypothetical protein
MTTPRPSLERLIDEAAKLPPGPQGLGADLPALSRTHPDGAREKFLDRARRHQQEAADELRVYSRDRRTPADR